MDDLPEEPNLSLRISRFNDILISAAPTHIGRIWTLDDSTRARKNPYSKLPPSDNSSKSTGVDRCLSWSHQNYQQGQGRKLERSFSRRNVKFRRPKYMESHPRSERYSWCHLPLTKQCPTTAEPSQTSNLMPTYSLITTQTQQTQHVIILSRPQPTIQEASQCTICWQWKLSSPSHGTATICHQKDER